MYAEQIAKMEPVTPDGNTHKTNLVLMSGCCFSEAVGAAFACTRAGAKAGENL